MRAHYLQHVPFEGIGSIESWLKINGYEITNTRLFEVAEFPSLKDIDLLVIMGGPMSVNDEDKYPWLVHEKKFIYEAIKSGKAVLGICLGAQLIASVMGARVYKNPVKEIGWFPVCRIPVNDKSVFCFPESLKVFHWHGETFDLPVGATRLAASAACKNQGFQLGKKVIALQFHLETTPESAWSIVHNCREELVPSAYIQTDDEILSAGPETYKLINHFMDNILFFLSGFK
jgi:GMP synthase-like glutamine amidotransferase